MLSPCTCTKVPGSRIFSFIGRHLVAFVLASLTSCPAVAASIESLISPGPMSTAHAEWEEECAACHATFDQDRQRQLCLDCHEEIAADLEQGQKFHGVNPAVGTSQCRTCHVEHEGREFDSTGLVEATFDHSLTEFELTGAHVGINCHSCHDSEVLYRDTESTCFSCHEDDDRHEQGLGDDCATCHSPQAWSNTTFDHLESTDYELLGAHAEQQCNGCHIDEQYEDTPTDCVDCHKFDDVHEGARGAECDQCHSNDDWQTNKFDHFEETGFELVAGHDELSCSACHLRNMQLETPPTTCVGCHSADDVHSGARGENCAECHETTTWKIEFDHEDRSGFALAGAHAELRCESCHGSDISAPLEADCEGCHEQDDPHEGSLGACDSCHSDVGWYEEIVFDHEFMRFPLVGLHKLASCDQCHETLRFDTAPDQCIECHREDEKHFGKFGEECANCHNSGGWELWQFDHDTQTAFVLSGAHEDLICASCHSKDSPRAENLETGCVSCHLADDRHNGQFGRSCDRCHTTTAFDDNVRFR